MPLPDRAGHPGMKRLFFALWPDPQVRRHCAGILDGLQRKGLRPVPAANLHVTLLFLGAVDARRQAAMMAAASRLPTQAMSLTFDRLSHWQKPGILCLTCAADFDPGLRGLAQDLAGIAGEQGIRCEERPFRPHVTLCRRAGFAPEVDFEPVLWTAAGFCLVESLSSADGVHYRPLHYWGADLPG